MSVILCTAGYDHTIRFWEALSGICSRTIQHSESQVNRLCISPDKRLLAAAGSEEVKLYDIRHTNSNPFLTFKGHHGNVTGVAFHCEGKWMVTSSEDGTVKIWDTRTATVQRNYSHGCPVNDVVIHPNQGELISCDRGGNVRIWDLGENKCTHQLIPEDDVSVASVTVATDGTLLCAGNNNGNIYIWRLLQNQELTSLIPVTSFQAHATYITRVLLSPDVRHLATCSADHNARIWSVTDPSLLPIQEPTTATPNGPGLNSGFPSAPTPAPIHTNPQESHSLSRSQKPPTMGSAPTPPPGAPGLAPPPQQQQNGISPGGGQQVNGNNPNKPAPFPLEANLGAHQRWVWDCAFSADSAYLVTASSDHYARLWELGTQSIIRQYNGHHRGAVCVALNDYSETR